jgi:hypothetical protein
MRARHQRRIELESLERRDVPGTLMQGAIAIASPFSVEVHLIHARGKGQITSFDKATGQVTTTGRISNGLLRGTTQFSAQIIDAQGDYLGTTTVVTKHGSVFLKDTGVLNADGTFTDHATVTGGTGRFEGATGQLVFQGHELADGVHFLDDQIIGTIATDRHA